MLSSTFNFSLNQQVQENLATVAKLDGVHPCLVCVNSDGKVFIHDPFGQDQNKIKFINTNKKMVSITSGAISPDSKKEIIFLGSQNIVQAFDVEKNSDLFYKDIPDGISKLMFSIQDQQPLIYVGGNYSIQGLDKNGDEIYWNVAGGNVSCMTFCDIDDDGKMELIVGTDDQNITVYKGEEILFEINESSKVLQIIPLQGEKFCYGLENGHVGIYQNKNRIWRVKSKYKPVSLIQLQDQKQVSQSVLIGWQNGRIEIRSILTGDVLFKLNMEEKLAQVIQYDYRMDNSQQIMCISVNGIVNGYNIQHVDNNYNDFVYKNLQSQVNDLNLKNKLTETNENIHKVQLEIKNAKQNIYFIIDIEIENNIKSKFTEIVLQSIQQGSVIKGVILTSENVLEGDSQTFFPDQPSQRVVVPINCKISKQVSLNIKVIIGLTTQQQLNAVAEITVELPKFVQFKLIKSFESISVNPPESYIQFTVKERIARFVKWMETCFSEQDKIQKFEKKNHIDACFYSFYQKQAIQILIDSNQNNNCIIKTESMELAANIIQDMLQFMNLTEMETFAEFPQDFKEIQSLFTSIKDLNQARQHLQGDISESVGMIKSHIVRAEDSRMLNEINIMIENRKIFGELIQRSNNHEKLVDSVKKLNQMINKAANLRAGTYKTKVITLCRNALKQDNLFELIKIIKSGKEI